MGVGVLSACLSVHCVHALPEAKEGDGFPGPRVLGGCELPWRCLELNPGLLGEQPGLLPSLQPWHVLTFKLYNMKINFTCFLLCKKPHQTDSFWWGKELVSAWKCWLNTNGIVKILFKSTVKKKQKTHKTIHNKCLKILCASFVHPKNIMNQLMVNPFTLALDLQMSLESNNCLNTHLFLDNRHVRKDH